MRFKIISVLSALIVFLISINVWADSSQPLPKFFGIYIVDSKTLIELKPQTPDYVIAFPMYKIGVDGLKDVPNVRVKDSNASVIVFREGVELSMLRFVKLQYIKCANAGQFNIMGTHPQFFRNVYGMSMDAIIPINMWVYETHMQFKIAPVEGKTGMYRIVPTQPLQPGVYVVHFHARRYFGTPHAVVGGGVVYPFVFGIELPQKGERGVLVDAVKEKTEVNREYIDPAKLEGEINRALRKAGLGGVKSEVGDNLSVTLRGTVSNGEERNRAVEIAKNKGAKSVKDLISVIGQ